MNMLSRSLCISCLWSLATYATPITILEKQLEIGKDPKTQKALMIKTYSFVPAGTKETADTRWLSVFPYEVNVNGKLVKELIFFSTQKGLDDIFPITHIISYQPSFDTDIDPTAQYPIVDPQKPKTSGQTPSLVTMHVTFAQDLQLFKELLILLAKGNVKALTAFVNKYTLPTVDETIEKALDSQGVCYIACDDPETLEALMQAKKPVTNAVQLTGKLSFVPLAALQEALADLQQQGDFDPAAGA